MLFPISLESGFMARNEPTVSKLADPTSQGLTGPGNMSRGVDTSANHRTTCEGESEASSDSDGRPEIPPSKLQTSYLSGMKPPCLECFQCRRKQRKNRG
ncbi:hypothetical protein V6N11_052044 [Hibiscus sabdariffa]|uniref:Uncharacterized protein n=1 Tax=Hibiscus sabdariffa TaxID=183260 RepID=A0ABR2U9M2_9ROSI